MLYDPKWEKNVSTPLLTGLIAWLERQPSDGAYDYESINNCLLCQYLKSTGIANPSAGGSYWRNKDTGEEHPFNLAIEKILVQSPWTYGGALSRARMLLTDI